MRRFIIGLRSAKLPCRLSAGAQRSPLTSSAQVDGGTHAPNESSGAEAARQGKRSWFVHAAGHFGTATSCAGLEVAHAAHAFELGALPGSEFGRVILDQLTGYGGTTLPALPDAQVAA